MVNEYEIGILNTQNKKPFVKNVHFKMIFYMFGPPRQQKFQGLNSES